MTRVTIDHEARILLLLCTHLRAAGQCSELGDLLRSPSLDWGRLIARAARHRLLPLLSHGIRCFADTLDVHTSLVRTVFDVHRLNAHRITIQRRVALDLVRALGEAGIRAAVTKGMILETLVYGELGLRGMSDVDLMVREGELSAVAAVFRQEGLEPGMYDRTRNGVIPPGRAEEVLFHLCPDHLLRHCVRTGDPLVPIVEVDVSCSLTWTRSAYSVPVDVALEGLLELSMADGRALPMMRPHYNFLFIALHLFREAWMEPWRDPETGVGLRGFCDLLGTWNGLRPASREDLGQIVESYGLQAPLAWTLGHLDAVLGTELLRQSGLSGYATQAWLASAGSRDGAIRRWNGNMLERLMDPAPRGLFAAQGAAGSQG